MVIFAGWLPLPPPELLEAPGLRTKFVSPLARAQKAQETPDAFTVQAVQGGFVLRPKAAAQPIAPAPDDQRVVPREAVVETSIPSAPSVAGAPIERAGVKTLLPRGMTADQFDTKTQAAMAPLAGQRLFVRGQPVPAESVALRLGGYGMRYNRGGYTPIVNNAPVTMDSSGSVPLVLRVQ